MSIESVRMNTFNDVLLNDQNTTIGLSMFNRDSVIFEESDNCSHKFFNRATSKLESSAESRPLISSDSNMFSVSYNNFKAFDVKMNGESRKNFQRHGDKNTTNKNQTKTQNTVTRENMDHVDLTSCLPYLKHIITDETISRRYHSINNKEYQGFNSNQKTINDYLSPNKTDANVSNIYQHGILKNHELSDTIFNKNNGINAKAARSGNYNRWSNKTYDLFNQCNDLETKHSCCKNSYTPFNSSTYIPTKENPFSSITDTFFFDDNSKLESHQPKLVFQCSLSSNLHTNDQIESGSSYKEKTKTKLYTSPNEKNENCNNFRLSLSIDLESRHNSNFASQKESHCGLKNHQECTKENDLSFDSCSTQVVDTLINQPSHPRVSINSMYMHRNTMFNNQKHLNQYSLKKKTDFLHPSEKESLEMGLLSSKVLNININHNNNGIKAHLKKKLHLYNQADIHNDNKATCKTYKNNSTFPCYSLKNITPEKDIDHIFENPSLPNGLQEQLKNAFPFEAQNICFLEDNESIKSSNTLSSSFSVCKNNRTHVASQVFDSLLPIESPRLDKINYKNASENLVQLQYLSNSVLSREQLQNHQNNFKSKQNSPCNKTMYPFNNSNINYHEHEISSVPSNNKLLESDSTVFFPENESNDELSAIKKKNCGNLLAYKEGASTAQLTLIVNVPTTTTRQDLLNAFKMFGEVLMPTVVCLRETRHPKKEWTATAGYAFVLFQNKTSAQAALTATEMGQVIVRGTSVKATWAKKDSFRMHPDIASRLIVQRSSNTSTSTSKNSHYNKSEFQLSDSEIAFKKKPYCSENYSQKNNPFNITQNPIDATTSMLFSPKKQQYISLKKSDNKLPVTLFQENDENASNVEKEKNNLFSYSCNDSNSKELLQWLNIAIAEDRVMPPSENNTRYDCLMSSNCAPLAVNQYNFISP
ncbi:probable cyclin-dependent serine/threonine-protein kinase DDB_G0292550 isoform X2 [Hylaeus volcanicus]|uniref:probable cyclin-dependent serine/threonine-protein kinase DDB_G0292550 isoform X2 n=1 Tax=Hylaeus volcanicus TaxID=313075 RepID=UPI0023B7AC0F|nr:probable cyclin-dependent serine/threonine-protein kinase DDB_G0292550 isoform X2 [Hylaeus volcanicus]